MRWKKFGPMFLLALAVCLTWSLVPAVADPPEECCVSGGVFGDGSDGDQVISGNEILLEDKHYHNLTVLAGATLRTGGHTVRVCDTLLNEGEITAGTTGGSGGAGGAGGLGADPAQDGSPPGCPTRSTECTDGEPGQPGGTKPVPEAGPGGHGGGGGGGGGGALYNGLYMEDADGGDGGAGGDGGTGGGHVLIYAFQFENNGDIHADGQDGEDGEAAPNSYETCGAEYSAFGSGIPPDFFKDLAGGGGGGGAGGDGGDGGTVEIYYLYLVSAGLVRADGGSGGVGAGGGLSGTSQEGHCLTYGAIPGEHDSGCAGGLPSAEGGHGGDGAHEDDECATDGTAGADGSLGAPGTVIISLVPMDDCNGNGIPDECDIASGESRDCQPNGIPDECEILCNDCNGNGVPDECDVVSGSISDLGTLGGPGSWAYGVNERGEVVGCSLTEFAEKHPFLWLPEPAYGLPAGMNDISPPMHPFEGCARDINESGRVAGYTEPDDSYSSDAFLWLPEAVCGLDEGWNLLPPPGGEASRAYALNDLTQVVGWYGPYNVDEHAFLWLCEPDCGFPAGMNDIHPTDMQYTRRSIAFDINDYAEVVGWAYWVGPPSRPPVAYYAWLWLCENPEEWDEFQSYFNPEPHGINRFTDVVGCDNPWHPDAFLCVPAWNCSYLPGLGGDDSLANAINDYGQIVGWAETTGGSQYACLWDNDSIYDLNNELPPDSEWELVEATDINNLGRIVGWGNYNGEPRAYLLTLGGVSSDCNDNGHPDECELLCNDCDGNGILDECDIADDPGLDVDPANGCLDDCDRDDCQPNGIVDWWDIEYGDSEDCNGNCVPDECDITEGAGGDCQSEDVNENDIPDECELLGDMYCDRVLDWCDVEPFVLALIDPEKYNGDYPWCDINKANMNGDDSINGLDIQPFVDILLGY